MNISKKQKMMTMMGLFIGTSFFHVALAQSLPFSFGNATNDIFTPPGRILYGPRLTLPKTMAYSNTNANFISQNIQGYVALEDRFNNFLGYVSPYYTDVDTTRGGEDQNQVSMRVGNKTSDLILARDIIAGNGTIFNPQTILVATWYKVELLSPRTNLRNTFQLTPVLMFCRIFPKDTFVSGHSGYSSRVQPKVI